MRFKAHPPVLLTSAILLSGVERAYCQGLAGREPHSMKPSFVAPELVKEQLIAEAALVGFQTIPG